MTSSSRGDVVLVPFMFSDRPVVKRRPAIVISSPEYHSSRQDVIVAAVTSNVARGPLVGDHHLAQWRAAGLPKASVVTGILRTIKRTMIVRTLGTLAEGDLRSVDLALARALSLIGVSAPERM
jgi:mRNA interferase MazF